jgi:hypothetical protein
MHVAAYRPDFETGWQGVADHKQAPLIDSWWNVVEPCVGEGRAKILCVHAVHEVAQLPAALLA